MIDEIVTTYGWKWLVALLIVFIATLADGAGKPRKPAVEEDAIAEGAARKAGVLGVAAGIATTLAVVFMLVHVMLTPVFSDPPIARFVALGAVLFVAAIAGSLGQMASAAPAIVEASRTAKLPLAVLGLITSGWAAAGTLPLFLGILGL